MARVVYGEPYDPEIRTSDHGQKIYSVWRKMRRSPHCKEWDYYPTFYNWVMESGYVIGAWLRLIDKSGQYCPENCAWYYPNAETKTYVPETFVNEWNRTVNRIRKHYGMPPLEGTTYDNL